MGRQKEVERFSRKIDSMPRALEKGEKSNEVFYRGKGKGKEGTKQ
jgi:hypothetical protein